MKYTNLFILKFPLLIDMHTNKIFNLNFYCCSHFILLFFIHPKTKKKLKFLIFLYFFFNFIEKFPFLTKIVCVSLTDKNMGIIVLLIEQAIDKT